MSVSEYVIQNELTIRISFFVAIFAVMATWEVLAPKRTLMVSKRVRWLNNMGLVVLNSLVLRFIFPATAVGVATIANNSGWGILNTIELPIIVAVLLSIIIMDFIIYFQHLLMHLVPFLWRLHRVHHADLDYDVTTGSRFHTLEIILSMLIKFATIIILGPPIVAVIAFEIILNGMAMFNHSNVRFPTRVDKWLRLFIVTPDMHRVHHSVEDDESNSNYGFNLSLWDRLFSTYINQPQGGHGSMKIGIRHYREEKQVCYLPGILVLPFVREKNKVDQKG